MKRFTLGSSSIGDLEKQYVQEVLDNNYISPGPVTDHVQNLTAQLHGMKHGLAIHSGQSAIHLAIQAIRETCLDSDSGRKPLVAVPACTYISTLAAAVLAGCDIVMVDVDLPSANMSASHLNAVIEDQLEQGDPVDIVIPVHLFGTACDPRVFEVCEKHGVWVVEDACESTFAPGIGRGHFLTTSFFSNHLISAGGGGVIMTNDAVLDEYCWKLVNHGRSARFGNDDIHRIAEKFHFDTWGHSMKWNDVSAAIAKAQIERREELYLARRWNARAMTDGLNAAGIGDLASLPEHDGHTFMVYPILLDGYLDANNVICDLNDNGIEVRRMMPITNQPVVKDYFKTNLVREFPHADIINRQGFYVGCHPELSADDIDEMSDIIITAISKEEARSNGA